MSHHEVIMELSLSESAHENDRYQYSFILACTCGKFYKRATVRGYQLSREEAEKHAVVFAADHLRIPDGRN